MTDAASRPLKTARPPGRVEFVAMMAMLVATVAFSIDAMLPALPGIGAEFSPDAPNRAQLVVGAFILGLGVGTFFVGPLSDRFGRKPVIVAGSCLYAVAALAAVYAPGLDTLIAARVVQGLGAAAARVVAVAIIRDMFSGREMARLMSFVMLVFTLVPAVAPMAGSAIIAVSDWHGIFWSFILFALVSAGWMGLRLPEPLAPDRRVPISMQTLALGLREIFAIRMVRLAMAVQTLALGLLFASISSIQQIMDITFDRGDAFPYWFALIALGAAFSSLLNAALVMRLGMRTLIHTALAVECVLTGIALTLFLTGLADGQAFAVYFIWQMSVFFQVGLTLGNLNALALEPLGHIAGMAASMTTGLATVASILLAAPIGLAFDGTPVPLMVGALVLVGLALWLMRAVRAEERHRA